MLENVGINWKIIFVQGFHRKHCVTLIYQRDLKIQLTKSIIPLNSWDQSSLFRRYKLSRIRLDSNVSRDMWKTWNTLRFESFFGQACRYIVRYLCSLRYEASDEWVNTFITNFTIIITQVSLPCARFWQRDDIYSFCNVTCLEPFNVSLIKSSVRSASYQLFGSAF